MAGSPGWFLGGDASQAASTPAVVALDETIKKKTEAVNLLVGESLESNVFRSEYSLCDADEALGDLIDLEDDPEIYYDELPYISLSRNLTMNMPLMVITN